MVPTAWLIEKRTGFCLGIEECCKQKWTTNNQALRFAREQDAHAYIKTHLDVKERVGVIVVDHEWHEPVALCKCHERDSAYVCSYCYSLGRRGHMGKEL